MPNVINVLMCGGRRTGKTSIMAAMEANMQKSHPRGDILLSVENSGRLSKYRLQQKHLFEASNYQNMTYYADDSPNQEQSDYRCQVMLHGKAGIELNFIDIPGEWFVTPSKETDVIELMKKSQILVIAVDSPHLVEKPDVNAPYGFYHEVFNRPEHITNLIKKAIQGSTSPRMILFVPVKCELYKNNTIKNKSKNMKFLLDQVCAGYQDLLKYVSGSKHCEIACAPCITMGGMEFLHFVPPRNADGSLVTDEYGAPLKDIMLDEGTGNLVMTFVSEYIYLVDANGKRYYAPEDCDQPLHYILLFLIGVGKMRTSRNPFISMLMRRLFNLPDQAILDSCKASLLKELNTDVESGFQIINDPYNMFH